MFFHAAWVCRKGFQTCIARGCTRCFLLLEDGVGWVCVNKRRVRFVGRGSISYSICWYWGGRAASRLTNPWGQS